MARPLNIVILGVSGVGKTTYLYRLVTAFLERRGISRVELAAMEPDDLLQAVEKQGITYDSQSTADFLRHAHAQMREHNTISSTSGDTMALKLEAVTKTHKPPAAPIVSLGFPGVGLKFTAANFSGDLVERAAHISQGDFVGATDEKASRFLDELRGHLKTCDGVLFFHAPHQTRLEADSEMVLRQLSALALQLNRNPFLPVLIVFTKADEWSGEDGKQDVSEGQYAQGQAIANTRERFVRTYYQVLQDSHGVDLDHPYWQSMSGMYRTGQNFCAVAAETGSFAELRGPIDQVSRLISATRRFYTNTRIRNFTLAIAAVFLLAVISMLSIYLPMFFAEGREQRVEFTDPREVYTWLQDDHDERQLRAGLEGVRRQIIVEMERLRGATSSWTERSFSALRGWVATLDSFDNQSPEVHTLVMGVRVEVVNTVKDWLDRAANGATDPAELPDPWMEVVERYVNGLGPYFPSEIEAFDIWRNQWREAQFVRLKSELKHASTASTAPANYYQTVRGLLEQFWRRVVDAEGTNTTLTYLRLPRSDARALAADEARRFAIQADEGNVPITVHIDKFVEPNKAQDGAQSSFPSDLWPTAVQLRVVRPNERELGAMLLVDTNRARLPDLSAGADFAERYAAFKAARRGQPMVFAPAQHPDGSGTPATLGDISAFWRPGEGIRFVIDAEVGALVKRTETVFRLSLTTAPIAPLPGYFITAYAGQTAIDESGRTYPTTAPPPARVLIFSIAGPKLPDLLVTTMQ